MKVGRCIVHVKGGEKCGRLAFTRDRRRGGMVCEGHKPPRSFRGFLADLLDVIGRA